MEPEYIGGPCRECKRVKDRVREFLAVFEKEHAEFFLDGLEREVLSDPEAKQGS